LLLPLALQGFRDAVLHLLREAADRELRAAADRVV